MDYLAIAARLVPVACCQLLALAACRPPSSRDFVLPHGAVDARFVDTDDDGLCDVTEGEIGTDSWHGDSDADGLPDGQEAIAGADPQNSGDPATDHVLYLAPTAGELTYDVFATIDGRGSPANGFVVSRSSLDPDSRRAGDYYVGTSAEAAEPPESARNIQAEASRFGSVVGRAQLHFLVSFATKNLVAPTACAAALPFDFVVRDDQGEQLSRETYILVVAATDRTHVLDFCSPVACL